MSKHNMNEREKADRIVRFCCDFIECNGELRSRKLSPGSVLHRGKIISGIEYMVDQVEAVLTGSAVQEPSP